MFALFNGATKDTTWGVVSGRYFEVVLAYAAITLQGVRGNGISLSVRVYGRDLRSQLAAKYVDQWLTRNREYFRLDERKTAISQAYDLARKLAMLTGSVMCQTLALGGITGTSRSEALQLRQRLFGVGG